MSESIIVISFVQDVKSNDRIRWQLPQAVTLERGKIK